jgi:serine/threonine-protein kinase
MVGAMLVSIDASAEPTAEERAIARTLFDEGRALAKDGKWPEACAKLEASQRSAPGIGTLFNLADCYEHIGKTASAWTAFSETADQAKRAGQGDRETIARDRAAALAPKLAKLRFDAKGAPPPGLELRLDGKVLAAGAIGTEIPVDPGDHKVNVSATGKAPREISVRVEVPAAVVLVDLPKLDDASTQAPVTPPPPPPIVHEDERPWQKPAAIAAGGVAIVALGVGTIFGLRASSQWSDAKATCSGNTCDDKGYSGWQDARSSATIGTIGFVAGGVLAAAAVVLWITAPHPSTSAAR